MNDRSPIAPPSGNARPSSIAEAAGNARLSSSTTLWMLAILLVLIMLPSVLRGTPLVDAVRMGAFVLAFVAMPGVLLHRYLGDGDEDVFASAGMSWTIGYCALVLGYLAAKVIGVDDHFVYYPLIAIGCAALARLAKRGAGAIPASPEFRASDIAMLGVLFVFVVCRTPYFSSSDWWKVLDDDLLFHAGNAAELRNNWPMRDPRCAGEPLVYHFFSYALPASASAVTGLSISDVLYGAGAHIAPVMLALQIYNAGRLYGHSHLAGLIASALVMLHVDYGRVIADVLAYFGGGGGRAPSLAVNSYLHVGVYSSTSTANGLMLLATLAIVLHRWLASRPSMRSAACLVLVGAVASGVKGSIMPVVLAGLAACTCWCVARRRASVGSTSAALTLLALASIPMTIWLSTGEESFAAAMFRVAPGAVIVSSDAFAGRAIPMALATPLWLVAYFDLAGVGAIVHFVRSRKNASLPDCALYGCVLAGATAALLFTAANYSQLFFMYSAQIALAILAGAGLAPLLAPRTRGQWIALLGVCVSALPMLIGAVADARRELSRPRDEAPAPVAQYREGLQWMRTELPPDAVVISAHRGILISAFAERRAFYETDRFTGRSYAMGWSRADGSWKYVSGADRAYPELIAVRKRCFSPRPAAAIDEARAIAGSRSPIYLVFDDVTYSWGEPTVDVQAPAEVDTTERAGPRRKTNRTRSLPDRTRVRRAGSGSRGDRFAISPCPAPSALADAGGFAVEYTSDVMHVYRIDPP